MIQDRASPAKEPEGRLDEDGSSRVDFAAFREVRMPDEPGWATVAREADVPVGQRRLVLVGGKWMAIFHLPEGWFAIDNSCPHAGGSLFEGGVKYTVVTCPWHFWPFDLRTGRNPVIQSIRADIYPVRVEGGQVEVQDRVANA